MTGTNKKLREALLSDMDIAVLRMPVHLAFAGNMAQFQYHNRVQALLDRIEALATPTAEQVDDINVAESFTSVTKTAEPVGDREAFEREMRCEEEWGHRSLKKRQNGQYENWQVDLMWAVWQARAAMSAGDAVDAQRYRWLADCNSYPEAVTLISDGSLTADALGKAIDAAMRKDKL